jgi:hypothetical protein
VLQPLLDARSDAAAVQLPRLTAALCAAARGALGASPKLGQAMMALAMGFGPGLAPEQVAALARAAGATKTFLTKGLLAKLAQLEQAAGAGAP